MVLVPWLKEPNQDFLSVLSNVQNKPLATTTTTTTATTTTTLSLIHIYNIMKLFSIL